MIGEDFVTQVVATTADGGGVNRTGIVGDSIA